MRADHPPLVPPSALQSLARTCAPRITHPRACIRPTRSFPRVHVCANAGTTVPDGRTVFQRVGAERGACCLGGRRPRGG